MNTSVAGSQTGLAKAELSSGGNVVGVEVDVDAAVGPTGALVGGGMLGLIESSPVCEEGAVLLLLVEEEGADVLLLIAEEEGADVGELVGADVGELVGGLTGDKVGGRVAASGCQ